MINDSVNSIGPQYSFVCFVDFDDIRRIQNIQLRLLTFFHIESKIDAFIDYFEGKLKLFTQKEVADIMGISEARVQRLRLQRKLSYIPGRPVLIAEADLSAYLDRVAERTAEREAPKRSKSAPPERTPDQLQEETLRKVRQRAQIVWMRRQNNLKRK